MRAATILALASLAIAPAGKGGSAQAPRVDPGAPPQSAGAPRATGTYVGFDRNDYPGDDTLDALRKTFVFCGYWLNNPPGENTNTWKGKRETLRAHRFGILVLFNGRSDKELKAASNAALLGTNDADAAVKAAQTEGFAQGTVIFVDQEEGGRMLPEQREYLYAWIDRTSAAGYRAGVYCSGMPDTSGSGGVITARDIRENSGRRPISFFVYNDTCPPSPGCVFSGGVIPSANNGIPFAAVWQIAQSPRRRNLTPRCRRTYASDGNCYAPGLAKQRIYVDVDVATSADPSGNDKN